MNTALGLTDLLMFALVLVVAVVGGYWLQTEAVRQFFR